MMTPLIIGFVWGAIAGCAITALAFDWLLREADRECDERSTRQSRSREKD